MKISGSFTSSRIARFMLPVMVLAAGIGIIMVMQATKPLPEKKDKEIRPLSVFTEPVQTRSTVLNVQTQGEVRARTEIDLVAQVGGRILSVSPEFTEGGLIEPDITLITIEDTDYRLALSQAEVRVAEAEVRVQQAQADANVARKQLRNDPSATALALKRPQMDEAKARLKAARADLEQARLNLERTQVSLPFHGRLISTQVDVGQYVTPGTRLGKAFATDIVEVRLPFTDSQLASLGLPIGYVADGEADKGRFVTFSAMVAGKEHHWNGYLVRLDASVDSRTRLFYGMAEVMDPYGAGVSEEGMPLAVGLYVDANIAGQIVENVALIPRQGLRAGNQVYLVNDVGQLEIRKVNVLHSSTQEAFISAGIYPGEQVVVSSIRNPIEGMALASMMEGKVAMKEETLPESNQPAAEIEPVAETEEEG